ncbi:methyltransferase [Litorimonas cladophorae]|uniref:Methyltransferase n=1 Tax=Litorimonas cladophorae TaxID=1220491 RepID=A0A918KNF9_9PROT|nr:class I SAM-dependent methyltransferase [Litorimonas cladophorae]GGX69574.1 methyltransferase [Litorimonas cladophorae]
MRRFLTATAAAFILAACSSGDTTTKMSGGEAQLAEITKRDTAKLAKVLAVQPEKTQARYVARHPAETLEFFGIAPGMAIGEALPGGGWYTKILVPYLGSEGKLVGIDYALEMYPEFSFANEAFMETKRNWPVEFVEKSAEWAPEDGAEISATTFGDTSGAMDGQLDAVLFVRAMHNLSRFEDAGQYMTNALAMTHDVLKPGGIVGVVQHRAPASATDEWADGSAGYLKEANVIAAFKAAGFEFVKSSEINANPNDQPVGDDIVWRLPPSMNGVGDNEALKAERLAIGESDRMTLLFRKP